MSGKSSWVGIGVSVISIMTILLGIYTFFLQKPVFYGATYDPPRPAAEIIATDARGNSFQLSKLRGKIVILYFGYLHCPLECPLTMAHLQQVFEELGATAREITVVMISTDPHHDTPEAMNAFLGKFNPSFLGIAGNNDTLSKIYKDYNVVVLEGGETHSSFTYVIDRSGNLRLTFVPDSSPQDIEHDLKILLNTQE